MDVANHYPSSLQQLEWATGCDDLKDMAMTSRKRILDMLTTDKDRGRRLPRTVCLGGLPGEIGHRRPMGAASDSL